MYLLNLKKKRCFRTAPSYKHWKANVFNSKQYMFAIEWMSVLTCLPRSNPSVLPHHIQRNERWDATDGMSRPSIFEIGRRTIINNTKIYKGYWDKDLKDKKNYDHQQYKYLAASIRGKKNIITDKKKGI